MSAGRRALTERTAAVGEFPAIVGENLGHLERGIQQALEEALGVNSGLVGKLFDIDPVGVGSVDGPKDALPPVGANPLSDSGRP